MIVVQIGTNHGNDHVLEFCKKHRPDQVFLVEPFEIHEPAIRKNYADVPNVELAKVAIVPDERSEVTLYYHDNDTAGGTKSFQVTSMVADHVVKHGYSREGLRPIVVPAVTLNAFLRQRNLYRVDYLFLDVEGIDFDVLKSLDLETFDVQYIQIEWLHLDQRALHQYMQTHGYVSTGTTYDREGYDILFKKM